MRSLALTVAAGFGVAALAAGCGSSSNTSSNSSSSSSGSSSSTSGAGGSGGGGSSSSSTAASGSPKSNFALRADPNGGLKFTTTHLNAKAGSVTLAMHNPSSSGLPHGIGVEGKGVDRDGKVVAAGGTSTVTVALKKGTYEFYCPVPSHKAAGMKGTITVQ